MNQPPVTISARLRLRGSHLAQSTSQLSRSHLMSVSVWMKRLAVLQGTRHCDLPHSNLCDTDHMGLWPALLRSCPASSMLMQSKWETRITDTYSCVRATPN